MKLFGLIESMRLEGIFGFVNTVPVPHEELFRHITDYSPAWNVGLQLETPEEVVRIPPVTFQNQEVYLYLYKHFKKRGNKIHFLESREHFEKVAEAARRKISLKSQLGDLDFDSDSLLIKTEMDKASIEFDYLMMVGVEDIILGNIVKTRPEAVFIGQAHADAFYRRRQELESGYGIVLDEYWRDEMPEELDAHDILFAARVSSEHTSMETYLEHMINPTLRLINPSENIPEDPSVTSIKRLYKSIKEGKVTDGSPHFVGTWNMELEHRGLFEVYVHQTNQHNGIRRLSGDIEDCLGSAFFIAVIDSDKIKLEKIYYNCIMPASIQHKIIYEGGLRNGDYLGRWNYLNGNSGSFKMRQVRELETYGK